MARTAFRVWFISTVNDRSKKKPWNTGTSSGHITNLKQSIFDFRYIWLYHPLDGITNLKYGLLCFLTPNKKISKRKILAFHQDRCCHLALCLALILFHWHLIELDQVCSTKNPHPPFWVCGIMTSCRMDEKSQRLDSWEWNHQQY